LGEKKQERKHFLAGGRNGKIPVQGWHTQTLSEKKKKSAGGMAQVVSPPLIS
jgi:hypothetical protein